MNDEDRRLPVVALDTQLGLLRWATDDQVIGHLRRMEQIAERPIIGGERALWERAAESVRASLSGMTLWIGSDVAPLIEQASRSIPHPSGGAISAGIIMAPAGVAWIAGDPAMIHYDSPIVAVSWRVQVWPLASADGTIEVVPVVMLWPWANHEGRPLLLGYTCVPLADDAVGMVDPDELAYRTASGVMEWSPQAWAHESRSLLRWMLAVWVMAGQVLPQLIISPPRAMKRRAGRLVQGAPPTWGDIHVVTLRRAHESADVDDDGDHDGPVWGHQWVVRGHWRWQPHGEGRALRKLIWIGPHIKGPEGAPLIEVEQIAKLVR